MAVTRLALSYGLERTVPIMPLVTAGLVLVFGGPTLLLDDERFIKMKPTIARPLYVVMFGGLIFNRPVLKPSSVRPGSLKTRAGGNSRFLRRLLHVRRLERIVWRQSTDVWGNSVFGLMGLTFMFI